MTSSKKVIFVIPWLEGGGAERAAANLLREFSRGDIEVVLLVFNKNLGYGVPKNIRVISLDIKDRKNLFYIIMKFFVIIFRLSRVVQLEKPMSILSFMDYTNIVVLLATMFRHRKPKVVLSVHSAPSQHLKVHSATAYNIPISVMVSLLYNRADAIIAVSNYAKHDLATNFGIDAKKILTIYNPLDLERISLLDDEPVSHPWFEKNIPVIICVGRLSREKGLPYLLKAFSHVLPSIECGLMIIGSGPEEANLKSMCSSLGLEDKVFFAGFQDNPYKFLKRSTVYVMSSLYEGFPNALIEAMACGLPVISTRFNDAAEEIITDGKNGLLVPPADDQALADAILRLLRNTEERKMFAEQGRARVKELSLEKISDQYRQVLFGVTANEKK